jgi:hypothetical protein
MKLCPKCRTYFADSLLRFCTNDGTPLVELNQTSELWSEGTEYIRETNKKIRREVRRSQIKKIVSMLVTTVVITSVISVITLKSWIYTHPKEVEEILREKSGEKEVKDSIAESTPKPQASPIVLESTPLTAIPVQEATPIPNRPDIKITPKPTAVPTATPLPSPTPIASPTTKKIECTAEMKEKAKIDILNSNRGEINQGVGNLEKETAFRYYSERHPAGVRPENLFNRGNISVEVKNCSTATAISKSEWLPTSQYLRDVPPYTGTKTFSCKKGKNWKCDYVK